MNTVVAFHAHPDDESSKGAGTMARLADAGVRCVLVCATGGEAGDVLNPAMRRPGVRERLAELRRAELARAASIIGYDEVIHLGYRDSGMPGTPDNDHPEAFVNAAHHDVLGALVEVVRRERPDVVFGYDSHERYPHPDHLKVHDLTMAVREAAADADWRPDLGPPWMVPLVLAPAFTAHRLLSLHEALEGAGIPSPLRGRVEGVSRSDDDAAALVRAHIGGYVERARDALRAHETQIDPEGHWFAVPVEVVESVYPYEDFVVLASGDAAAARFALFEPFRAEPQPSGSL